MGGKVGIGICVLAAIAHFNTGHPILFWASVISGILVFWTYGIMHNYAMDSAKARWDLLQENMILEGRTNEEIQQLDRTPIKLSPHDANASPNWLATMNMIFVFAGLILLVWGVINYFT